MDFFNDLIHKKYFKVKLRINKDEIKFLAVKYLNGKKSKKSKNVHLSCSNFSR